MRHASTVRSAAIAFLSLLALAAASADDEPDATPASSAAPATDVERDAAFRAREPGAVLLVQLVRTGELEAFQRWARRSREAARAGGGRRAYAGALDHAPGEGPLLHFDVLLLDAFPSREAALSALAASAPPADAVADRLVIPVRPAPAAARAALRAAAALVWLVAGREVTDAPPLSLDEWRDTGGAEIAIGPRRVEAFMDADPERSLVVLNLNRTRERAHYAEPSAESPGVSGAEAYGRYGRRALFEMMLRGGRPLWLGTPEPALRGEAEGGLAGPWDGFALVFYPSRLAFRDMVASPDYRASYHHRVAALERAAVLPGRPWGAYDPKR